MEILKRVICIVCIFLSSLGIYSAIEVSKIEDSKLRVFSTVFSSISVLIAGLLSLLS